MCLAALMTVINVFVFVWREEGVCVSVYLCTWRDSSFCCDGNSEELYWLVLMESEISSRRTLVPVHPWLPHTHTHTHTHTQIQTRLERSRQWIEIESNHILKWFDDNFRLQSMNHSLSRPCKVHSVLTTERGIQWQLTSSLPGRKKPLFIPWMSSTEDVVHLMWDRSFGKVSLKEYFNGFDIFSCCLPPKEKKYGYVAADHLHACECAVHAQQLSETFDHVVVR